MADWTSSMQQYFEYYVVDPGTWRDAEKLNCVKSCTISRDAETETLGSASFEITELLGECYVRVYLITVQNGVTEKHPLGTFLVQTPNTSFDGKVRSISLDAYTPLIELKENQPEVGYYTQKYDPSIYPYSILDSAYMAVKDNARAPVVNLSTPVTISNQLQHAFVAESGETWLKYIRALLANAKHEFSLDEMSRILFTPIRDIDTLSPLWTYDDGNSSILYPEVSMSHDLFGIPNVVEVTYSSMFGTHTVSKENNDISSPVSIPSRGRRIPYRVTNPSGLSENPTYTEVDLFAENLLKSLSTLQCSVTYTHGYCPVRLGDCVRLDYTKAGLNNTKAKVISQTIKCVPGCQVQEKAIFNVKLWR